MTPPSPSASPIAGTLTETPTDGQAVPRFELAEWREQYGLLAGVTGRTGDFDLGLRSQQPAERVFGRWSSLAEAVGPGFPGVAAGHQVHGVGIRTYLDPVTGWLLTQSVDGHLTNQRGLILAVTVADCVPVYLAHPDSGTIALLHAGWRGTAAGIVESGIRKVCSMASCAEHDVVMHCGVSICGLCYEVGPEVRDSVLGSSNRTRGPLDLRAALKARAVAAGVTRVTASTWCSAHDNGHFYSHRKSHGTDGRMVAYLGRPFDHRAA